MNLQVIFCSSIECKTWLGRRQRDDLMINTISKTLEAQEKTQDIKQSPSMKIGTKPYARSRRNELTEVIGRWTRRWESDRTLRSRGSANRRQQQRPDARPNAGSKSIGRRTTESGRVQRGSRAAKMRPDASGGMWSNASNVRSVDRGSNGRDDRTRPIRTTPASS